MSEVRQYHIRTLEDILQLDERQREDFIKDLSEWMKFRDDFGDSFMGLPFKGLGMVWNDDSTVGCVGVQIMFDDT